MSSGNVPPPSGHPLTTGWRPSVSLPRPISPLLQHIEEGSPCPTESITYRPQSARSSRKYSSRQSSVKLQRQKAKAARTGQHLLEELSVCPCLSNYLIVPMSEYVNNNSEQRVQLDATVDATRRKRNNN